MPGYDRSKYDVIYNGTDGVNHVLDPDDFFVIRKSDILGLATLQSYRSNIMTLIDLDELYGQLHSSDKVHLLALADDVGDMVMRWERATRKIPD